MPATATVFLENSNRLIQAADVRQLCGSVSDMTIWRWVKDSELNFPKPIYIGRVRYWREAELMAWIDTQQQSES